MITEDAWIANNSPIDFKKLHALGVIVYRWNACEFGLRILLTSLGRPINDVWEDNARARRSVLLEAVEKAIDASPLHTPETKDALRYAIKMYEVNAENRNQFAHFLPTGSKTGIKLYNTKTPNFSEIFSRHPIPSDLEDFRKVANEIAECQRYISAMSNYLVQSLYDPVCSRLAEQPPLPPKPDVPELHWTPPPQA